MAGSSYLSTLLNILPAVQTRQIMDILAGLQNSGGVLTPKEFEDKLKELTAVVNKENRILPTFELSLALPRELCRSSIYNGMLTRAKNDINSAFLQLDEIGSKLEDHNILFVDSMIRDLDYSVDRQQETIKRLKWLAGKTNEFTYAIVDQLVNPRSIDRSSVEVKKLYNLYYDDRSDDIQNPLAYDPLGKKLTISANNTDKVRPTSAQHLSNAYSYQTENEVDDPDNKLVNLIDGKKGTFWTRNIYSSVKREKVTTVLQFNFDTAKDVSYISIESGSSEPVFISSIVGVSPEGNEIDIYNTSVEIDGRKRIDFGSPFFVRSIIVFFETKTYKKIDYVVPKDVEILDVFESNDVFARMVKKEKLGKFTRKVIVSDKAADACLIPEDSKLPKIEKYRYLFSLDNVWFGNENYLASGMFVSKPLKIENVGTVGISTEDEVNTLNGVSDAIEYDIAKVDQLPRYNVTIIPVPKINQTSVESERLVFSARINSSTLDDMAVLRFCPLVPSDWEIGDDYPVNIYKNGNVLDLGTDWQLAVSSVDNSLGSELDLKSSFFYITDFDTWNLLPQKMVVVINNIDPNAVYTASYSLRFSDSPGNDTVWLDDTRESYIEKGKVVFKRPDNLVKSNIYLIAKMRRNLSLDTSTPKLYEYSLLGSAYN